MRLMIFYFNHRLFLSAACLLVIIVRAERVPVHRLGYSYTTELSIYQQFNGTTTESTLNVIIDTSTPALVVLNNTDLDRSASCLARVVDSTDVEFYSSVSICPLAEADITLGSFRAEDVEYAIASNITIQNDVLHQWDKAEGVFGLGYNKSVSLDPTAFQRLVLNETFDSNMLFGLDLNSDQSDSFIDIGEFPAQYKDTINWGNMPTTLNPSSYQTFISHLAICDQTNLLTNWSTSWTVIVDTGSSCLTLPKEIYNTLIKYLNTSVSGPDLVLPSLSFQMTTLANQGVRVDSQSDPSTGIADTLSIYLEHLVVEDDAITIEKSAIPLYDSIGNSAGHLCVLKGGDIQYGSSNRFRNPPIVFGALTLNSLYFAADASTGRIGFAQKPDPSELIRAAEGSCVSRQECVGEYVFNPSLNSCARPECTNYFFSTYNEDDGDCSLNQAAVVVGCLFLVVCILMEMWAYLIVHHGCAMKSESDLRQAGSLFRIAIIEDFISSCLGLLMMATDYVVFSIRYATPAASDETADDDAALNWTRTRSGSSMRDVMRRVTTGSQRAAVLGLNDADGSSVDVWGAVYSVYKELERKK